MIKQSNDHYLGLMSVTGTGGFNEMYLKDWTHHLLISRVVRVLGISNT